MTSSVPTWEQLHGFVDDLERSLAFDPGVTFDCDDILLCGVGGSAVSSDFASDCCYAESVKPIRMMKYPDIPRWVSRRTLAVVSSYSGNTAETLEMYSQARARGCQIVAVTSGGRLKELAEDNGDFLVMLPEGMHPRHAIGFMIGYTLAIIHAAGGPDICSRISDFIPDLRNYRDHEAIGEDSTAMRLAHLYRDKVPVICSDCNMRSVAFRWKTQMNENSKFVAFSDSEPSFGIRSLKAWSESNHQNMMLTFLIGCDHEPASDGFCRVPGGSEIQCVTVRLGGASTLENMFRAIILGDYTSIYLAGLRDIDPAEVRPVMRMKEKLSGVRG